MKKNLIHKNVLPLDPTQKVRLIIYYKKFKTSNLIISNNTSSSTKLLHKTNIVYMFKFSLGHCILKENSAYVGLTNTTFSKRLTMHLNDSSSIALHLKTHSIPKSKFQKILVENTTIITQKIDKLWLQILEALHIKTKKPKINRINFENSDNVLKCFY